MMTKVKYLLCEVQRLTRYIEELKFSMGILKQSAEDDLRIKFNIAYLEDQIAGAENRRNEIEKMLNAELRNQLEEENVG